MRYQIILEKVIIKFLQHHKDIAQRFFDKVEIMEGDITSSLLDIKPLQGEVNCYRLRIGKYRFLYRIDGEAIVIYFYDADSRGSIYK